MPAYELDDKNEKYSPKFLQILDELNRAVSASGAKLEGNLFYFHGEAGYLGSPPNPGRIHKRRNFFRALRFKKSMLEIGFNGGHSALLALSANKNLKFVGVDICINKYAERCSEIIKSHFGDRFEFRKGDSRDVVPQLATHSDTRFDLLHVDGGHGTEVCRTDISNCIRVAAPRAHLLLDDTSHIPILDVFQEYVSLGLLQTETLGGTWEKSENLFGSIIGAP